ncbi:MAG: hypothetical protein KGJ66_07140 [Alphaproteobacteria bacterium]|nr:hypothetical protein [Alphaproteobacteria bacterium]
MKLLLRRGQKSGVLSSSVTFTLDVRADLTEQELANIKTYKLGKEELFSRGEAGDGLIKRLRTHVTLTVDDLVRGKRIDCPDIVEMLDVVQQIKESCKLFKRILDASAQFGGEEVIEF